MDSFVSKQWSCATFLEGAAAVECEATAEQLQSEEEALLQHIQDGTFCEQNHTHTQCMRDKHE